VLLRERYVPTTADTIDEVMKLYIALERLRLLEQSDNNNAPTVATITPASATEGSPDVFELQLEQPSAKVHTFVSPMELLEVLITLPLQT
jgi:hypothetical protein